MFYYDYTYLILVIPALILSLWASAKVKLTFNKYSKIVNQRNMTGRDAAVAVLRENGVCDVNIAMISGDLTDNYNPKTNTISLSEKVYNSTSVAAVGVAAHEAGHAVQYATGYAPIRLRNAIIPATKIGSYIATPLFILGLILTSYFESQKYLPIAYIGIAFFALSTLFQFLTLPAEINASRRAIAAIDNSILTPDESRGAKKVLTAAALTYVAALAVSIMSLLRLLIILARVRRD